MLGFQRSAFIQTSGAIKIRAKNWHDSARIFLLRWGRPDRSLIARGRPFIEAVVMNWFILVVAGLLEIIWAIGLKYTEGYTRLWPTVTTVICLSASFILLGISMKTLPVGTAYAIWVGIGAAGTAKLDIMLFDESAALLKLVSLALICAGVVGLKLAHA